MAQPTNFYRINAPAGSGKTYYISQTINDIIEKSPLANVLCITYTNRAAEVMKERIISPNVSISTIHAFLNSFLKPFFENEKVINYYIEIYKFQIEEELTKTENVERYKERLNIDTDLTVDNITSNIKKLYYNERQYSFLLDGGLSHDDLLDFSFKLIEKFSKIGFKLREMYQYVFIDEVQDTSAEILKFFCNSAKESQTQVYFLGDKMQEIYNKYDGSFENEFETFDNSISKQFNKNYRSSKEIVDLLNKLYKSKNYISQGSNKGIVGYKPKILLTSNIEQFLDDHREEYGEFYKLRTVNIKRFENINNTGKSAGKIYKDYQEIYPNYSRTSVMDVLGNNSFQDNPDELMCFLNLLFKIKHDYSNKNYGEVIRTIKSVRKTISNSKAITVFEEGLLAINFHKDKLKLKRKIDYLVEILESEKLLGIVIEELFNHKIINKGFYDYIFLYQRNGEFLYTDLFCNSVELFKLIDDYNRNPRVSTQHGVKGEGHPQILFVSEDSPNPGIKIYNFFNLFTQFLTEGSDFNLDNFQSFYYNFNHDILELEKLLDKKISAIKADDRDSYFDIFQNIYEKYLDNDYFKFICLENNTLTFQSNTTVKNMKNIFSSNLVRSTLTAYKLFYVGCSRAEDELVVLIDKNKINDVSRFTTIFESIGFQIVN
ncbi:TPA: ATP-dependent helicase [Streptococcus suis]|uniref:UvrD-helicase domain-containing protein n=1 Tax=Streptococcus suis TaxID=1307 RepID=UPI000418487D|nr:UvrD-helicase domain-containing protein [Streptococcus suis]HEM3173995.1 ATP-dependent helicase [Streptococcus suis]